MSLQDTVSFFTNLSKINNGTTWELTTETNELLLKPKQFWHNFFSDQKKINLCKTATDNLNKLSAQDFKNPELLKALYRIEKFSLPNFYEPTLAETTLFKSKLAEINLLHDCLNRGQKLITFERLDRLLDIQYGNLPKFPGDDQINKAAIEELIDRTPADQRRALNLKDVLYVINKVRDDFKTNYPEFCEIYKIE